MSRAKSKRQKPKKTRTSKADPAETQTSQAATVAWTLTITTVLLCDVAAVVGHLIAVRQPEARAAVMFRELLLFSGTVIGLASLALLPVVYRVRRAPPPTGFAVFGVCAAVAPMLALVVRALS